MTHYRRLVVGNLVAILLFIMFIVGYDKGQLFSLVQAQKAFGGKWLHEFYHVTRRCRFPMSSMMMLSTNSSQCLKWIKPLINISGTSNCKKLLSELKWDAILNFVHQNPGSHLRRIKKELSI